MADEHKTTPKRWAWSRVKYGTYRSAAGTIRRMKSGWFYYEPGARRGHGPIPTLAAAKASAGDGGGINVR
jgi:hypothetical protein